jgi:cell division protein FtsQ
MSDERLEDDDLLEDVEDDAAGYVAVDSPAPVKPAEAPAAVRAEKASAASIGWLVVLALGVIVAARQWLVTTPYFALRDVRIEGASHRTVAHYEEVAGLTKGRNVLALDLAEARRKLLAEAWVEDATVVRRLPGRIDVTVHEREPLAVLALEEPYLVTATGNVFKTVEPEELVDRPVITGLTTEDLGDAAGRGRELLRRALDLAAEYERGKLSEAMPLEEVHVEHSGEMVLRVGAQGVALELGHGPYRHKLDMAAKVLAEVDRRGGRATALLLDGAPTSDRVVVRAR